MHKLRLHIQCRYSEKKQYTLMQGIKRSSTFRVSADGNGFNRRIIYRYWSQDAVGCRIEASYILYYVAMKNWRRLAVSNHADSCLFVIPFFR